MASNFIREFSQASKEIQDNEKKNGDVFVNRFRYLIILLFVPIAIFAAAGKWENMLINFFTLGIYVLVTVCHTLILMRRNGNWKLLNLFCYLTFVIDILLYTGLALYYTNIESPDNFAFAVKNPVLEFWFIPLIISLLQFRRSLVIFGGIFIALNFIVLTIYGYHSGMVIAETYPEHVLGQGVLLDSLLSNKLLLITTFTIVIMISLKRVKKMMLKIGNLEAQKASLSRYFSPKIAEKIMNEPDLLAKGSRHEVTILFIDIRNFTSISEKMDPELLIRLLSDFRERMVQEIFKHNGSIDKFIGDAIMATFGTPIPSSIKGEDTKNALKAAMGMLKRLEEFNLQNNLTGENAWHCGIGLHSGEVFSGNIGSSNTREYTVIGDAVNTASRIESLCKTYSAKLLLSEDVYKEVKDIVQVEKLDPIEIRGKEKPIQIFKALENELEKVVS